MNGAARTVTRLDGTSRKLEDPSFTSAKLQAASNKLQAPSSKHQASSRKRQAL